ncbi:DJ-1/PfpI family protein [Salicibibacter kimchii]|uniref:DJ-1/PfpI family protein n=1 Tax=Salicibibacter kimchii TaxID=2099786 RepID=A0A345BYQ2_9BACI|nr:DJ-1/PfpI family protein [Salicibibacter kimchii]AXF56083.1 DJ-1/PfpI family protein [Salicibibacter kimchii]
MKKKNVGILLYDFVDILDFAGPAEVLSLTAKTKVEQYISLYKKQLPTNMPFEVSTIAETGEQIKTHSGIRVEPQFSIDSSPKMDIIIIPGGPLRAVISMVKNQKVKHWLTKNKDIEYICSVCTGSFILGETGLLNGRKATTHHLALNKFQEKYPEIIVETSSKSKLIQDGNLITSGGVSSGINMALYLVEEIMGKFASERTAKTIEFSE